MAQKSEGKRGAGVSMIQEAQLKPNQPSRIDKRSGRTVNSDIGPKLEHEWFEFDRDGVLRQIDKVRSAIDENAKELGLVAAEGVFEKTLSQELLRSSQGLRTIARELRRLRGMVTRTTGYTKAKKKRS
jgi:hypothetical protein